MASTGTRLSERPVPRITLTAAESADALGISVDTLERYVLGDVRVVRRGRLRLIPVAELERWADENAARTLGEEKVA
jgi:excisionase family DNA binding protein